MSRSARPDGKANSLNREKKEPQVTFRDLLNALRRLGVEPGRPVIVHTSLSAYGHVQGGAGTVVGALLAAFGQVMMPTFTYKTMLTPERGPEGNGLTYGSGRDRNRMAEFFHPSMPADPMMGATAEALRQHSLAKRSNHPILSFAGVNLAHALAAQTLEEPLAPIHALAEEGGWVILLGVDHTVNTSIHYAERLAGRQQFTRWALTPQGVVECSGFPGCSDGFRAIMPHLNGCTASAHAGKALVQAVSLFSLVAAVRQALVQDPLALLCSHPYCQRCEAFRARHAARPLQVIS